tara:strand:- start:41 stop:661 length:621 start_codon:yes stop_codon:yes gene_type:complete
MGKYRTNPSTQRRINYQRFNHIYKLYCPDDRKRFICFYCGLPADTVDHVPPLNCVLNLRAEYENLNYLRVPSCGECNRLGSDEPHIEPFERKDFIQAKIREKYKKYLKAPDWEEEEIEEMGFSLRGSIEAMMALKYLIAYRITYATNKKYTLKDFGYSNIDPGKMFKYAKADNWDETVIKVVNHQELSLKETNLLLATTNYSKQKK